MHMRVAACRSEAHNLKPTAGETIFPAEVRSATSRPAQRDTRDPAVPCAPPACLPHPHPRCPAQPRPCLAKGRRRRTRGGWESLASRVIPVSPPARLCCNPFLPVRRKRPAPTPRQRLARGREHRACPPAPLPGKLPLCPAEEEGGRPETFPPAWLWFPGLQPGTLPPRPSRATEPAADARRPAAGARTAGVTC